MSLYVFLFVYKEIKGIVTVLYLFILTYKKYSSIIDLLNLKVVEVFHPRFPTVNLRNQFVFLTCMKLQIVVFYYYRYIIFLCIVQEHDCRQLPWVEDIGHVLKVLRKAKWNYAKMRKIN